MDAILYHHPRCSKSRAALELVRARGIEPRIRDYLGEPPSPAELRKLIGKLGIPARALLRTGEPGFAGLGLADPDLDDGALITAMAAHPRLIERPILVVGDRAMIGRPPERLLALLDA